MTARVTQLKRITASDRDEWLAEELDDMQQVIEGAIAAEGVDMRAYVDTKFAVLSETVRANTEEVGKLRMAITTAAISLCGSIILVGVGFLVFRG